MVGFQGIFFHQLKKACDIAKREENCPRICHWPRAHSLTCMKEKEKKNTLIHIFRSCLILMDLGRMTGKKEI